jgi:RNA polymerase sigma-70 factor (ECF subfamily)
MEEARRSDELEKLMSELSWLKRLATALVRDESDADDLVQETWLVASERAPTDGRPLKPWLSRVALNLVRMKSRASKRRLAREAAVEPETDEAPAPEDLVDRVRAQRIVADEVLRLAEPYRSTILLHYFEGLSSADIARRAGIPEGTVRRRLKVALDELRGRIRAQERTTGQPVVAALAPLAGKALGGLVVKKVIALVLVVIGLVVLGTQLYKRRERTSEPVAAVAVGSGSAPAVTTPITAPAPQVVVSVTDGAGPVVNAYVRFEPVSGDVVVVKTAADGTAALSLAAGHWSIAASAEGHEPAATSVDVTADTRVPLVLALGGQTLTGIVKDVTGGEIAGARIDAARLDLSARAGAAVAVTYSDSAGRYKLVLGSGQILVAASHPEYAAQTRYVDLGAIGATTDFALVPGGVIEGVVRAVRTNQPVAGAVVRATSFGSALELAEGNERRVTADAAGRFRVAGLRPAAYELSARAGALSSRVTVGVDIGVAEQLTNVVVLVSATATIRGKVVDDAGAPASNVTVTAMAGGHETTTPDAAGAFVFEGLPPDRWLLSAASDRYLASGDAVVDLAKSDVDGVVVRVRRALEARGHVEPREVCEVEITKTEGDDPTPRRASMITGTDGAFHFAPFGPGTATLVARCPSGNQGTAGITIGGESIVRTAPGGSIAGRLVDTAGKPVLGATVNAETAADMNRFAGGAMVSGFKSMTSTNGAFEITGLAAADYRLSVLDTGRPLKTTKLTKLALAAGQHATGITVVVERPTGKIYGTVIGADGAPIADAWVSVHQTIEDRLEPLKTGNDAFTFDGEPFGVSARDLPPAMTDARGHFELTGLRSGRYQLRAEAQSGVLRGRVENVTTDAEISIRLSTVASLRGTVHGARGPTELFSVSVAGPTPAGRSFTDGTFVFPRLHPGDYTIDVESVDGTGSATMHISEGQAATVDIALVPNGTITGRVVDKAGKPRGGLRVALIPDQPPGELSVMLNGPPPTSGPDGRFRVEGAAGKRTLVILGRPITAKRGVLVAGGTTLDLGDVTIDE